MVERVRGRLVGEDRLLELIESGEHVQARVPALDSVEGRFIKVNSGVSFIYQHGKAIRELIGVEGETRYDKNTRTYSFTVNWKKRRTYWQDYGTGIERFRELADLLSKKDDSSQDNRVLF
jgi:hypothetical protein